mgnify:CR=1 FL=1
MFVPGQYQISWQYKYGNLFAARGYRCLHHGKSTSIERPQHYSFNYGGDHTLKDHNIIALIMEVIITETAIQTPDTHSYMYKLISSISFEHFSKIRDIKFSWFRFSITFGSFWTSNHFRETLPMNHIVLQ